MHLNRKIEDRFWAKVDPENENGCWMWTAGKASGGYGQFWVDDKHERAHRVAYELLVGPVPAGMHVLHRCDNPPCCNPRHLFIGSNAANVADCVAKGRQTRNNGESNGKAKLAESDVRCVVALCRVGATQKSIGDIYGITGQTVSDIIRGCRWSWLTGIERKTKVTV